MLFMICAFAQLFQGESGQLQNALEKDTGGVPGMSAAYNCPCILGVLVHARLPVESEASVCLVDRADVHLRPET